MINELLLLSKNDIPFLEAQISIHQPSIREISFIGEKVFFSGCQFLNFSKNLLPIEDRSVLEGQSDFDIFMTIMRDAEKLEAKAHAKAVLNLIFPNSNIKFTDKEILLATENNISRINNTNFDTFKDILVSMFCLNDKDGAGGGYDPIDKRAAKIAEKFQKAQQKKHKEDGDGRVAILSRYVSILAVGESKSINDLMEYSVFQLEDEFKRFQMKYSFDINLQARMAGAKDVEDVDNWMDDIHPE